MKKESRVLVGDLQIGDLFSWAFNSHDICIIDNISDDEKILYWRALSGKHGQIELSRKRGERINLYTNGCPLSRAKIETVLYGYFHKHQTLRGYCFPNPEDPKEYYIEDFYIQNGFKQRVTFPIEDVFWLNGRHTKNFVRLLVSGNAIEIDGWNRFWFKFKDTRILFELYPTPLAAL